MHLRVVLSILAVLLVCTGVYLLLLKPDHDGVQKTSSGIMPPTVTWLFAESAAAGPETPPKTKVIIRTERGLKDVGIYDGTCFDVAGSNWELVSGEISAVICYWAGGGTEIGVFEENGEYVVKEGVIEEPTEETDGIRGVFKTLFVL